MEANLKKILFVPDTHRPYHDKKAWDLMLRAMEWWQPDIIVHLGDLCDFYKVSRFSKDPQREFSFDEEVADCNVALDELDALGAARKLFIEGNHEDRVIRYLQEKAPELFKFITVPKLLRLEERGWEHTSYKDHSKIGKLYITHDVGIMGRYSTYKAADIFQHPVVVAHSHRLSYLVEGNATGEAFVAAQFGWLGDIDRIDYMHKVVAKRFWALGFGTGLVDERSGYVYLTPHPIVDYSVVVEGRRFT